MTTKTLRTAIVAILLAGSALAGVQVAASPSPAPTLATDGTVVLIVPTAPRFVPTASGLKVAPSPVVRIAP
jgi:hypothetical protein